MTIIESLPTEVHAPVQFDLYRDVHKAIRAELFAVTAAAGQLDPADDRGRDALAARVADLGVWLHEHAHHEDTAIEPDLRRILPDVAESVAHDHASFDGRFGAIVELAREAAAATGLDRRHLGHRLYLDLASFTSVYLAHQDVEERVVMPALEAALGVARVLDIHHAILASIPPEEMADTLALMIPAINLEDQVEMLGGMKGEAPPEVFAGVWALAGSVLPTDGYRSLGHRLGLG